MTDSKSGDKAMSSDYWMQCYTGKQFFLEYAGEQKVSFVDIARSLSRIPRFNGHTRMFISIAEHSHAVMEIVVAEGGSEKQQLAALLHDAHEAFIGDMILPVKAFLIDRYSVNINGLAKSVQASIEKSLGVAPLSPAEMDLIHKADMMALALERKLFMGGEEPWPQLAGVKAPSEYEGFWGAWEPDEAMLYFERAYDRLKKSVDFETRIEKEESAAILEQGPALS